MSNAVFPSLIRGLTWTVLRTPKFATLVQQSSGAQNLRIAQYQNPLWEWSLIWDYLYDAWPGSNNTPLAYAPYTDIRTLIGFFLARQGKFDDFLYSEPSDMSVGPALISAAPNAQAVLQVVTDGFGRYFSPIQRNMGGLFPEDITDLNPAAPASGAIAVYANAAAQTAGTNYTVGGPGLALPGYGFTGLYLAWACPVPWLPDWAYALNFEILDSNGNVQKVTTAGTSGAVAPIWNTTGTTADGSGSLVWTSQGANPAPATPVTAAFNFYYRVTFDDSQDFEQTMQQLWTIGGGKSKNGAGYLKLNTSRPPSSNQYNTGSGAKMLYGAGTVQITWLDGSVCSVYMDGQGNAWITFASGTATAFGYGNVQLVTAVAQTALIGSGFSLGVELIVMEWISTAPYFTGPAARNSDSAIHATLVNLTPAP